MNYTFTYSKSVFDVESPNRQIILILNMINAEIVFVTQLP